MRSRRDRDGVRLPFAQDDWASAFRNCRTDSSTTTFSPNPAAAPQGRDVLGRSQWPQLEVRTTEPGMLFYTGYYTSDDLAREDGTRFGQFRGVLLRDIQVPERPEHSRFASQHPGAGQQYDETTVFKLMVTDEDGHASSM